MAKPRRETPFSLSFLDIMACGFGAVTLLFLILRHNVVEIESPDPNLTAEVNLLQEDVRQAEEEKVELLNSLEELELELITARGLSRRVLTELQEQEQSIQSDPLEDIAMLRRQVEELERETASMEEVEFGDKVRQFLGEGNRQYLTGLMLGGERVLILVDGSASMLADTVVNAVRRRNMDDEQKRNSPKWQWTVRTVEWLLAQLPPSSRFQIYIFNTEATPAVADSAGEWLDAADSLQLEDAVAGLREFSPGGGTSLENAFTALADFAERPDNLFLLTDGLPTQGRSPPTRYMVSGEERRRHFLNAVGKLPQGIPVNTILFPMEGDPEAAALYWQFAMNTRGAFVAPSRDWP
ncbi:MAG: VWA domain-containing protein [Xanthomonadales bacterium]|nr:VWA domain-containing protein [Xanthomonadales bacterium]NIN58417.1 VWA domain-containing protein [Xanthomonadales bacterium]NIN73754.1 VWA domain-containing protein [Xanthomonadales bacterium]NIO13724.1 VWA domain-containing protein [Xanthomonadales bacterium]NIP10810.1 VWA domain-containing protein [Xanthomonadales bacterium]